MRSHSIPRRRPAAGESVHRIPTIGVVDPHAADDSAWDGIVAKGDAQIARLGTAEEALRFARQQSVDLWVVNGELPVLSGYELCRMLKQQSPSAAICVVTNDYSTDQELQAWRAGATFYACKPGHREVLAHWLGTQHMTSQI